MSEMHEVITCRIRKKIATTLFCSYTLYHFTGKEQIPEDNFTIPYQEEDLDLPHYDLNTLAIATNGFSFSNLLGEGGFGPVYKVTH